MMDRLKYMRKYEDLTQREVALGIDVNRKTYSSWEKHECDIPLEKFSDLANFYHVTMDYLIGISDNSDKVDDRKVDFTLLANRLKTLRKENKYTQQYLGEKTGFYQKTYSNYEIGINIPTTYKLLVFAQFYNVSLDYLAGRSDERKLS